MQPRKKAWTIKLRKYVVKQCLTGVTSIAEIARNRGVSRRSIYMLLDRYKKFGMEGLEPEKRGRKKTRLTLILNSMCSEFGPKCQEEAIKCGYTSKKKDLVSVNVKFKKFTSIMV